MSMQNIIWEASDDEAALISDIADRAVAIYQRRGAKIDRLDLEMSLTAVHLNGCPLRLEDLLEASDFSFMHDIAGISRHIDKRTGELTANFLPRYAAPQEDPEAAADLMPADLRA